MTKPRTTYATLADAQSDGWRCCSEPGYGDRDVSGVGLFGYDFEALDGRKSVTIWLTLEPNRLGKPGAFRPMIRRNRSDRPS